ncbi:carbohydrate ABC transporter permease [Cohnella phaseoli]|uniref:Carbohydrate ABC transporter membrane protein 2 (CUT1 family) n=1 Tax=Cohnella phaseoli TaxID=456490 RepID=A0A3D9JU64_9BACL|nr:carbohydrate ABC transporter permease [Cohnella phaseoli]RED77614.1 carbohydrate ABC transporter membrane protein 2 (CUT1 family) [Cohnella phaseoli]
MKKSLTRILPLTLAMACIGLLMFSPFVITFTNSFMTEREILGNYGLLGTMPVVTQGEPAVFVNLKLIPDWLSFEQYRKVLLESPTYLFMFWNSAAMVAAIIAGQTIVSALAAYAFAKLRFKGREGWFRVYLMTMLMPFQVTLVPNYLIADKLGLLNTAGAIILPGIFAAFGVFMLRQFMLSIPYALVEAAQLDGAGHYRIFYRIMLPLMKPGIAALIILLFVDYWNMVEQPLIFLKDAFKQPLSLYLSTLHKEAQGIGFAASLIYMAPMVLLFLYAEAYFIEGVQMSGIKG